MILLWFRCCWSNCPSALIDRAWQTRLVYVHTNECTLKPVYSNSYSTPHPYLSGAIMRDTRRKGRLENTLMLKMRDRKTKHKNTGNELEQNMKKPKITAKRVAGKSSVRVSRSRSRRTTAGCRSAGSARQTKLLICCLTHQEKQGKKMTGKKTCLNLTKYAPEFRKTQ